jgi:snail 2
LSTKPRDLIVNHKSIDVKVKLEKDIKPPADIIYQQKFWPMPSLPATFFPFQLYSALLPHHEPYEFLNYSPIRLTRDSSLSPPAAAFIEPIKQEKAAKISHGLVPYHQNLLPLSPASQHLSFNASFTSQSKPSRIMTSAKILTDFKISTLLKPTKEKEVAKKTTPTATRYQCPDCKKSYSTYSGLVKHQQFHCFTSDEKKVQKTVSCDECGKVYGSTGALKMHIRTHTLPCKCHLCGKAFSRPWLLQGHIRTHTGEKPFSCNHCHRAFADRSNLRAHLQTHSDVKKYSCATCRKTFSRMSLLTKHNDSGCQIVPMV